MNDTICEEGCDVDLYIISHRKARVKHFSTSRVPFRTALVIKPPQLDTHLAGIGKVSVVGRV